MFPPFISIPLFGDAVHGDDQQVLGMHSLTPSLLLTPTKREKAAPRTLQGRTLVSVPRPRGERSGVAPASSFTDRHGIEGNLFIEVFSPTRIWLSDAFC